MRVFSHHTDWFRDGHVNQAQPMEIFHKIFAGALYKEASFYTGIAKLVGCGHGLGTAISATTRTEPPYLDSCLIQVHPHSLQNCSLVLA